MTKKEISTVIPEEFTFEPDRVFRAEDYLYFYEDSLSDGNTEQEIDFLVRELSLQKRMKILDLACGHGRHANRLAKLGYSVTGVDRSQDFLAIAVDDALQRKVKVRYVRTDIRKYMVVKEYDRVIHLFSSFGYFPDPENEQIIRNVAASLRPGGLFCLDILNRDAFLHSVPPVWSGRRTGISLSTGTTLTPSPGVSITIGLSSGTGSAAIPRSLSGSTP